MRRYSTTRLRWVLLILALTCLSAGLWWIAAPLLSVNAGDATERIVPVLTLPTAFLTFFFESVSDSIAYKVHVAIFLGVLLVTQWMFLRPRRGWTIGLAERARPMRTAVAAGAFMAMVLSVGAIATLLEIVGLWDDVLDQEWQVPAATTLVWALWAFLFYAYWRKGTRFEQLRQMAQGLIVGSFLEVIVAAGVFVWKTDEDDCWCARGSYTGLVFGATVMIWAFGPGLLFLFLRESRYHRSLDPASRID